MRRSRTLKLQRVSAYQSWRSKEIWAGLQQVESDVDRHVSRIRYDILFRLEDSRLRSLLSLLRLQKLTSLDGVLLHHVAQVGLRHAKSLACDCLIVVLQIETSYDELLLKLPHDAPQLDAVAFEQGEHRLRLGVLAFGDMLLEELKLGDDFVELVHTDRLSVCSKFR